MLILVVLFKDFLFWLWSPGPQPDIFPALYWPQSIDLVVSVTRSRFSLSGLTLVTRMGGLVSSGRTLLWALLSLHTALTMLSKLSKLCAKEGSTPSQAASEDCHNKLTKDSLSKPN